VAREKYRGWRRRCGSNENGVVGERWMMTRYGKCLATRVSWRWMNNLGIWITGYLVIKVRKE